MKKYLSPFVFPSIAVLFSLIVSSLLLLAVGESPLVLLDAFHTALFTDFGLGYTLFYTTPLLLTGLSVAVCFRCGLFNIGAEGQLYFGSLTLMWSALFFPGLHPLLAIPFGIFMAALGGAFWGGIAGILKAKRGSHEVIVTILLNFLAYALCNYWILYPLHNPQSQNPETVNVASPYYFTKLSELANFFGFSLFQNTPVNLTLFLAVLLAVCLYYFLFHTPRGFALRAVGANPRASLFAGIAVNGQVVFAMVLGGAFAGLVGVNEVMGHQHKVIEGFSPQYGFTGIAVALLARSHPIAVIASALLFGFLHNSARELEFLSNKVTKELAIVIQGVLIATIASQEIWRKLYYRFRKEKK
jgi:simple sugar transport system permease protein